MTEMAGVERVLFGKEDLDELYTERAHLTAALTLLWPSTITKRPGEWEVVTLHTPAGDVGHHIAEEDLHHFKHVTRNDAYRYDGHTKEEALNRLRVSVQAMMPTVYPRD